MLHFDSSAADPLQEKLPGNGDQQEKYENRQ